METNLLPYNLKDEEFEVVRRMVYQETGISLSSQKKMLIQSRLAKRLKELGCPDYGRYLKLTRLNPGERSMMFNLITTNVTKFFREPRHFEFLMSFVPQYTNQFNSGRMLKVWSAACSTGQEPFSIAMSLNEIFEKCPGDFRVMASDINTDVLKEASTGIYRWEQVQEIPYELLKKYFKLGQGSNQGLFRVKEELQRKITFKQINLVDINGDLPCDGKYDFIFCRNVFIYFDQETKRRVIKKLYKKLNTGGCLFLGHSESLNTSDLQIGRWKTLEHTVYMKQEGE